MGQHGDVKILIVGGSVFLGRAVTAAALARGHGLTQLNRGKTPATIPPGVEHLTCDRDGSLEILKGRAWDAVIDTCAYFPRQVRSLLAALESGAHYTLISTISVYADDAPTRLNETSPVLTPLGDEITVVDGSTYGPLKSGCEQIVQTGLQGKGLIIRPGIIVGPHDPTGRFGYWMRRLAGTEEFIAPGDGSSPLQVIDVRDLAEWIIHAVEQRMTGVYDAVGPEQPLNFCGLIETGRQALASRARPVWVPEAVLAREKVEGWSKLPLWLPGTEVKSLAKFAVDGRKARAAGLRLRPLAESIVAASAYEAGVAAKAGIGLSRDDERAVLARYQAAGR